MLRGKMDRIVIIILSILPRSILFIMLNNKLSGFRISYLGEHREIAQTISTIERYNDMNDKEFKTALIFLSFASLYRSHR